MKKLFTAIQKNDYTTVKSLLDKSPELISCVSGASPKKFEGQSPLQVALKESDAETVRILLGFEPDVNFIEDESYVDLWRAPVIHDAINRAIMNSRWNVNRPDGLEVRSTKEKANEAFEILLKIVDLGADVNAKDSYGNACLDRACLQARQILPKPGSDDRLLTAELREDISRIFRLLIEKGADLGYIAPNAFGRTYTEQYEGEVVGGFLSL